MELTVTHFMVHNLDKLVTDPMDILAEPVISILVASVTRILVGPVAATSEGNQVATSEGNQVATFEVIRPSMYPKDFVTFTAVTSLSMYCLKVKIIII